MISFLKKCSGKPAILILILILIASALITYGENIGIPTWSDLRNGLGLNDAETNEALLKVTYFNVGDADCAYVHTNDFNMVIDTGYPTYESELLYVLRLNGITRLDAVVMSHGDEDHIGNTLRIIKSFNVDSIIAPKAELVDFTENNAYNEIITYSEQNNIPVKYAECGDELLFDDGNIILKVIAPLEQFSDINNNSLVIKLIYKNSSYLFTGDIEVKAQKSLLKNGVDLSADVIKVPHHGRASSFYEEFMKSVNAKTAVISCGSTEKFYVSNNLLQFAQANNISIYRTDINGNVTVATVGDGKYTVSIDD